MASGIQTETRGETHRPWARDGRPLSGRALRLERENTVTLSLQRESNFTFDRGAVLEPLRQTEFREQRGVEKGHNPRHPVGPQVQHM